MSSPEWITRHHDSTSNPGISTVILIYRLLGRRCAYALIWCISLVIIWKNAELRHRSEAYIRRITDFAEKRGKKLEKLTPHRHIYRFAVGMLEKMLAWKGIVKISDVESIDNALERLRDHDARKNSHIIIGSHIGDIEMLRAVNNFLDRTTLNIIQETENNKGFMNYLRGINQNSGINIIPVNSISPGTIVKLQESLSKGEWLTLLGDRLNSKETKSIKVSFLGGEAEFPVGPWIMASLLNVPVCIVHTVIVDGKRRLYMTELGRITIGRKSRKDDLEKYIIAYAKVLEDLLLQAPLDWFNFYDFWNEGENGE